MLQLSATYDVAIIGGGLAGLSLSIQLSKAGYAVILFEKEKYPFHKVCGEYISMEAWDFIESLGISLATLNVPRIDTLKLSAPNGSMLTTKLPLGGFGISRYLLDEQLANLAQKCGVHLLEETKVENVVFANEKSSISFSSKQVVSTNQIEAKVCCGTFGKRSNLDVKWKRPFVQNPASRISNFIAVKYHVQTNWPHHVIGLHNFRNGYCGISKIEADDYCLCYLTTAQNLKESNNSIHRMQEETLFKNPELKKIFISSQFKKDFPIAISQISFEKKSLVENGVLLLGDAAGMITPLCGNGMSMALHSSKIALEWVHLFLQKKITRPQLEEGYKQSWNAQFSSRLKIGRILQGFFGAPLLTNVFVNAFKTFPFLAGKIIQKTHGTPF